MRHKVIIEYEDGSEVEMELRDWVAAHMVMRLDKAFPVAAFLTALLPRLLPLTGRALLPIAGRAVTALLPRVASAIAPRIAGYIPQILSKLPLNILQLIGGRLGIQLTGGDQQQAAQQVWGAIQKDPQRAIQILSEIFQNIPEGAKQAIITFLNSLGINLEQFVGQTTAGAGAPVAMRKQLTLNDDKIELYYLLLSAKKVRLVKVR